MAAVAACVFTLHGTAQTEGMDEFVDDLMSRMTLSEKIGQLNLQVAGDITTGRAQNTRWPASSGPEAWAECST